jgi:transcriptional regulator with XRE-family HTH domain
MRWSAIIKQIRVTKGLKQQALASLLGVSQSAVSRWENHLDEPNLAAAKQLLAMASPPPVGNLELFSAEADAQFCPLAISTVDPLRPGPLERAAYATLRLTGSGRARGSTNYRASGIGSRQMNVLLSYDETRVGRTTGFAKILTMPFPLHEFIVLRIQPISRMKYQKAPFAMRVTAIGGERRA